MVTLKRYPAWVLFGEPPPHFGKDIKVEESNQ